MKQFNFIWR